MTKSTLTLKEALKQIFQDEMEQIPVRHSLQTDQCPPLAWFAEALASDADANRRQHLKDCSYCEKMIATQWRIRPPQPKLLVDYALGRRPELATAMSKYLQEHRTAATVVGALRALGSVPPAPALLRSVASALLERIAVLQESTLQRLPGFAPESGRRYFHKAFESANEPAGERLYCSLDETEAGDLRIRVDDPTGQCHHAVCQLTLTDGAPLLVELALHAGVNGTIGSEVLGRFAEIAPRLTKGYSAVVLPIPASE
jgi:hypothetical protein